MCKRLLVCLILAVTWHVAPTEAVELAAGGNSRYRIVVADDPAPSVRAAAEELATHLSQVTGATFPIVSASDAEGERLILVGPSAGLDKLKLPIEWQALEPEGFVIRTVGAKLVITGPGQGTLNGVYTFLEETVGCRWYAPDYSVIPSKPDLDVGDLAISYTPPFESRLVLSGSADDIDWSARQRLNTFTRDILLAAFQADPRTANGIHYAVWHVHTLSHDMLIPDNEYDRNPDFFALRDGKRVRGGQACLANPKLIDFVVKRAGEWIRSDPSAQIISISGGDFAGDCQCPLCQAEYKKHGLAGTYMQFVNHVAEKIEPQFPDVLIDTMAYHGTRVLPPGVKMRKNVVIRYSTMDLTCYYHALDDCVMNSKVKMLESMHEWVGAARRVWVWYYALPRSELMPYANLNSLSRNFKLMRDAGVKGFFIQARMARGARHGGLGELQSYLFAKLLWDPDYDVAAGTERFV